MGYPSILMDVIAAPGIEVRSERLNVLPIVTPYPLSKGSATILALTSVSFLKLIFKMQRSLWHQ